MCYHNSPLRELVVLYGLYWEKTLGNLRLVSLRLCLILFLLFVDYASYPFTVMNLSHESDYMRGPVSPGKSITFQRCLCLYPVGIYCTHCSTSCFSHIKCFEDSLHQHSLISIFPCLHSTMYSCTRIYISRPQLMDL